jgi:hypothetical protein
MVEAEADERRAGERVHGRTLKQRLQAQLELHRETIVVDWSSEVVEWYRSAKERSNLLGDDGLVPARLDSKWRANDTNPIDLDAALEDWPQQANKLSCRPPRGGHTSRRGRPAHGINVGKNFRWRCTAASSIDDEETTLAEQRRDFGQNVGRHGAEHRVQLRHTLFVKKRSRYLPRSDFSCFARIEVSNERDGGQVAREQQLQEFLPQTAIRAQDANLCDMRRDQRIIQNEQIDWSSGGSPRVPLTASSPTFLIARVRAPDIHLRLVPLNGSWAESWPRLAAETLQGPDASDLALVSPGAPRLPWPPLV